MILINHTREWAEKLGKYSKIIMPFCKDKTKLFKYNEAYYTCSTAIVVIDTNVSDNELLYYKLVLFDKNLYLVPHFWTNIDLINKLCSIYDEHDYLFE